MLNKNQSKRINAFKSLLVLPLLAIFLVGFGTEKVYQFNSTPEVATTSNDAKVEVIIDKNTTDKQLATIKNDLAKEGVDLSYTVVRNDNREIIDISLTVSGEGKNGASFKNSHNSANSENGISPLVVFIDLENNLVSIGSKGAYKSKVTKIKKEEGSVWVSSEGNEHVKVWSGLDEIGEHEDIIITKENGKRKVFINGEEVDEDELHERDVKVFIEEDGDNSGNHFSFYISSDDDSDIEVIDSDQSFFFIDNEDEEPLYIIDGKEASKKEVARLSPKKIATIDVSKGEAAIKKHGNKAKNGVVEIITKGKN